MPYTPPPNPAPAPHARVRPERARARLAVWALLGVALLLASGLAITARAQIEPEKVPSDGGGGGTVFVQRPVLRRSALVFNDYNLFLDPNPYVVTKEFSFVHTSTPDPVLGPGKQRALFHLIYQRSGGPQATERTFGHAWSRDLRTWFIDTLAFAVDSTWWNSGHVWSPSLVQHNNRWYMFYTGVDANGDQRIGYTSAPFLDTTNTVWDGGRTLALESPRTRWAATDPPTYSGFTQFRDPYVTKDPSDPSRLLLFYAAHDSLAMALGKGGLSVGIARSGPGEPSDWTDLGYVTNTHIQFTRIGQLESPHVFSWPGYPSGWCLAYSSAGTPPGEVGNSTIRFEVLAPGAALTDTARASWSEPRVLKQYLQDDPTVFGWSGTEHLRVAGTDFLAGFTAWGPSFQGIAIARMHWQGGDFTLGGFANAGVDDPPASAAPAALVARSSGGSRVRFAWRVAAAGQAQLEIFDVSGRRMATPLQGHVAAGNGSLVWRALDAEGTPLASGTYFARLTTPLGQAAARFAVTR